MMKQLIMFLLVVLNVPVLFAQDTKTLIHEGDELYRQKKYKEAEEAYRKAAAKKDEKLESNFNLGDALYREKKLDSADRNFAAIAASSTNPLIKAEAYHNLGNSLLTAKKYDKSIDAYKKALMNNPQDDQTRYNLAYAEEMSKKNPPPPPPKNNNNNNKNNNNKNNSDKNKNDKDKNNKDKNKSDKDKSNSDKSKSDQDKGNPGANGQHGQAPPPSGVSKEDAQRMLDALNEQEKGTQQKLSAKKVKAIRVPVIKDW
jgi:Ca-activated chloride channel family protein